MNENILDDDWYDGDESKKYVRTERIIQVEKFALIGTGISIVLWIWSFFAAYLSFFGFVHLGKFFVALPVLIWWRSISIKYDTNPNIKKIVIPDLLKILRGLMVLVGVFLCFTFFSTLWFLYRYIDIFFEEDGLVYLPFFLSIILNTALGVGYLYYWSITKKSMERVG